MISAFARYTCTILQKALALLLKPAFLAYVQGPSQQSRCSTPLSSSSSHSVPVDTIADHVSCGLCEGPVAGSLLLSCSHLFCGACLFTKLQQKACCPTCNMELRAIPIRCLAMDKVAASIVPSLSTEEQQEYSKRKKDGQCVADQVNKMFHYLAPPPLLNLNPVLHKTAMTHNGIATVGQMEYPSSALNPVGRRTSYPGAPPSHVMQQQQQHQPYVNPLGLPFGSFQGAAAGPNLLQLAAAQQLAQMQQLQQQLSAMNLNPAAAAAARVNSQYPCRQLAPDHLAMQHLMLGGGRERSSSLFGSSSPPAFSSAMGYQEMQLSSMMDSMCQV